MAPHASQPFGDDHVSNGGDVDLGLLWQRMSSTAERAAASPWRRTHLAMLSAGCDPLDAVGSPAEGGRQRRATGSLPEVDREKLANDSGLRSEHAAGNEGTFVHQGSDASGQQVALADAGRKLVLQREAETARKRVREARVDRFKAELKARMRVRSIDIIVHDSFPVQNAENSRIVESLMLSTCQTR